MLPDRYKYWVNKLIDSFKSYDTRTRVGVLIHKARKLTTVQDGEKQTRVFSRVTVAVHVTVQM